jgi:hypothetical protein
MGEFGEGLGLPLADRFSDFVWVSASYIAPAAENAILRRFPFIRMGRCLGYAKSQSAGLF